MGKNLLLILLVFWFGLAQAQTISKDKPLHFGAGLVIGGVGGYAANKIFKGDPYWTWAGAIGSSLAAGITKEAIDEADYGGWDNNDVLFTALGGIVSGLALELLLKKKRRGGRSNVCNCGAVNFDIPSIDSSFAIEISSFKSKDLKANLQALHFLKQGL